MAQGVATSGNHAAAGCANERSKKVEVEKKMAVLPSGKKSESLKKMGRKNKNK